MRRVEGRGLSKREDGEKDVRVEGGVWLLEREKIDEKAYWEMEGKHKCKKIFTLLLM